MQPDLWYEAGGTKVSMTAVRGKNQWLSADAHVTDGGSNGVGRTVHHVPVIRG